MACATVLALRSATGLPRVRHDAHVALTVAGGYKALRQCLTSGIAHGVRFSALDCTHHEMIGTA